MTGARATSALRGTRFGSLQWVDQTGSTNADALEAARKGAPEGLVVVADHQTAGRGRHDRTWVAPAGSGLLVSIVFRPPTAEVAATVPMVVSLALLDAVEEVAAVRASLKWPNDVVAGEGDRKLAGMLAEADWPAAAEPMAKRSGPSAVVVGVGVNVNWGGEAPHEIAGIGIALDELAGRAIDREDLLIAWLRGLDTRYERLVGGADSSDQVLAAWKSSLATIGRQVRVSTDGGDDVEGRAVDVTAEGHLVVKVGEVGEVGEDGEDGEVGDGRAEVGDQVVFAAGDVVHLRSL